MLETRASHFRDDLRFAVRMIRRSPVSSAAIVLTLALGIGANAAIFGVIDALLLRPLPVADPGRLVTVSTDAAIARGRPIGFAWSFRMWQALRPQAALFDGALAWTPVRFDLADAGERQSVDGIFASGTYFATLGVPALIGRTFTADDDRPGGGTAGAVAVISHGFWQRHFGGAASVVGTELRLDRVPVTIVGVTPAGFSGADVGRPFDVAVPLEVEPAIHTDRPALPAMPLVVMLRLKPGQSPEAGTATLRGIQSSILAVPSGRPGGPPEPFTLVAAPAGASLPFRGPAGLRQIYARPLAAVLSVVLGVLLLACLNIANLLLARATGRRHELSVRLALGARRSRLIRQLLVESMVLAAAGAIGGVAMARWASAALVTQISTVTDRVALDLSLDWRILAFTAATTVAASAVFGIAPARLATAVAPMDALRAQGGVTRQSGGSRLVSLSNTLVVVQVALSLALVIAGALIVRSFGRLTSVPLGFDPDRVLVVEVDGGRMQTDRAGRMGLFRRLLDAARGVPGVAHAGGSIWTPLDGGRRMGDSERRVAFNFVTPGWFAAYGTPIRLGRDFGERDGADAPPVVVVNEAYVRAFLPGRVPLGEAIPDPRSGRAPVPRTIVGVVDDAVFESQREGTQAIVYVPVAQSAGLGPEPTGISLGIRPSAGPPIGLARAVGAAVERIHPRLSFSFTALTDHVQASVRQERLMAMLSGFFGALALLIAAIGLYGVTSQNVNRRFREIGIRMALGADRRRVFGQVVGSVLALTAAGTALGLAAGAAAASLLRGMLFGLSPLDPSTFASAVVLFAAVAALAAALPAYKAARIEPLAALRHD